MRPSSWEALGLDPLRMAALSGCVGAAAGISVAAATLGVLGQAAIPFGLAIAAAGAYTTATIPKRSLDRSAVLQAREAPALAAAAAVYLQSTGSRARTVLTLHSEEPRLGQLFEDAKKATLLGIDPSRSLKESPLVRSDSASAILGSIGRAQGERLSDNGEEAEGIVNASIAGEETKFPAFLTIAFFMPIMLMLLAAIGHHDDLVSVASLCLLEVVVLDLAAILLVHGEEEAVSLRSPELARMDRLRQVMRLSARGKGMASAFVETFRDSRRQDEQAVARSILLGRPVEDSVLPILSAKDHSTDLLMFLVAQAAVDAPEASRRADRLSELFERWVRAKQSRLVDQRIMETRSLMVSGIVGGVTAMVSAIAPVLSTLQLSLLQSSPAPSSSPYLGVFFAVPGAFFLGLFFSPRRAVLNTCVALLAYGAVAYLFSPLVTSM